MPRPPRGILRADIDAHQMRDAHLGGRYRRAERNRIERAAGSSSAPILPDFAVTLTPLNRGQQEARRSLSVNLGKASMKLGRPSLFSL